MRGNWTWEKWPRRFSCDKHGGSGLDRHGMVIVGW